MVEEVISVTMCAQAFTISPAEDWKYYADFADRMMLARQPQGKG